MHITRKLVEDFFAGRCSAEEEQQVREWFIQNPDALKKYLTEESWENFTVEDDSVPASAKMLRHIDKKTRPAKNPLRWVAAASVLLAVTAGLYFFQRTKHPQQPLVQQQHPSVIFSKNILAVVQKLVLPDGSISMLAPGGTLTYDSGFISGRTILLSGEASFSVAKDSTKPFCVHAKNINVTALGTMFNVTDSNLHTSVTLFEGKVVIRKEMHASKNLKEVFLTAGQVFKFNNQDFSYALSRIKKDAAKKELAAIEKQFVQPVIPLNFNNQHLAEVFAQIQKAYHVKIQFKEGAIEDMRFTGIHNPATETLEAFLTTLAMLNDLKVKKTSSGYFIMPNE